MNNPIPYNLQQLMAKNKITLWKTSFATGINKNTLRNIVYGNCVPKADHLLILCDFFKIGDIREFMTTTIDKWHCECIRA